MQKILIIGAGIAGMTAALCLSRKGFNVTIIEQSPAFEDIGAGIQLSPNAMQVLTQLNLAAPLKPYAFYPKAATMRHYQTGEIYFQSDLATATARYGTPYIHIHRADLISVLSKAVDSANIPILVNHRATEFIETNSGVTVKVHNPENTPAEIHFDADIVIGADGIHSALGAQIFQQEAPNFTHQIAWRGLVETAQLPAGLIAPEANVWVGPHQHFVAYYVRGGTLVNFVAVQEIAPNASAQAEDWHQKGDISHLRAAFSGWDKAIETVLATASQTHIWGLYDRTPKRQWAKERLVLIGDAAHPILPFMAQGAALAIEDAAVLADKLTHPRPIDAALKQFEADRKPRVNRVYQMVQKNRKMFHASTLCARLHRAILYRAAGLMPFAVQNRLDKIYNWKPPTFRATQP